MQSISCVLLLLTVLVGSKISVSDIDPHDDDSGEVCISAKTSCLAVSSLYSSSLGSEDLI